MIRRQQSSEVLCPSRDANGAPIGSWRGHVAIVLTASSLCYAPPAALLRRRGADLTPVVPQCLPWPQRAAQCTEGRSPRVVTYCIWYKRGASIAQANHRVHEVRPEVYRIRCRA